MISRAMTAPDLVKIRSSGQYSLLHVIIDAPTTIYTARATGAVGALYTLGFDGGSGTLGDCLPDMAMLIGSSAGAFDKGVSRLRKAPIAGTFYLGADSSLVTADNDYLTVIDDFELQARHPAGLKMDVDVTYTNQFTAYKPIPVMGEGWVIDAGDLINFDASRCWVPGSTITGYAWVVTGSTISANLNTATPSAVYGNSGRFRVELTVTANNGETYTGYRYVQVVGENLAPSAATVISPPEYDEQLGWSFELTCHNRPDITDRRRAYLYTDDYYGGVLGSIGPNTGNERLFMIGYIIGETIIRHPGDDLVEFSVGGILAVAASVAMLPAGLQDSALPLDEGQDPLPAWCTPASLTVYKGLHYLAVWRSTLARMTDIEAEEWGYPAPYLTGDNQMLLDMLTSYAEKAALTVRADNYSHIYFQRDAQLYPLADRDTDIPVIMTITDADWTGELSVIRRHFSETSAVEVEGELYSAGVLVKIGRRSPGVEPGPFGGKDSMSGLFFDNAATVEELAGLYGGWKLNTSGPIDLTLKGNHRFITGAPRQYIDISVDGTTQRCVPRRIVYKLERGNYLHPEIELEPRGGQLPTSVITYPGDGDPPIEPPDPPDPPPTPPPPPPPPPDEVTISAVVAVSGDVRTCDDIIPGTPDTQVWDTEIS